MTPKEATPKPTSLEDLIRCGNVEAARESLAAPEGDLEVFEAIQELRQEVEPLEGWIATKEKAHKELDQLPSDTFTKLRDRHEPFRKFLPAGHTRIRDVIYTDAILRDPIISQLDSVEVAVSALAATFKDYGPALVQRYEEPARFAGHAEVWSYAFEILARDILPPNLLKLTLLSIAEHPHYRRKIQVTRGNKTITKKPYDDEIVANHRYSLWFPRWDDRAEIYGPFQPVRVLLTRTHPIIDFDGERFNPVFDSQDADFKHQMSIMLRSWNQRGSSPAPQSSQNILEHLKMFVDSSNNPALPYAQYDTPYFAGTLLAPFVDLHQKFILAVLEEPVAFSHEEKGVTLARFIEACQQLEPAKDTPETLQVFQEKFSQLPEAVQNHWTNGFIKFPTLHQLWYRRVGEKIKTNPDLPMHHASVQALVSDIHQEALEALKRNKPK